MERICHYDVNVTFSYLKETLIYLCILYVYILNAMYKDKPLLFFHTFILINNI